MSIIFQIEFNEPNFIIIGYSSATVTATNHLLIMRLNDLLATTHATVP